MLGNREGLESATSPRLSTYRSGRTDVALPQGFGMPGSALGFLVVTAELVAHGRQDLVAEVGLAA
jgi:hypothetical protein